MCARGCCERRALRAGVLVAPWTVEKGSAGWRARMLSAGVALAQTYHVVQEPLRPTGEYLGHEAAEAARAGQLWEKIALYESAHPVSLKARAPIAPNPNLNTNPGFYLTRSPPARRAHLPREPPHPRAPCSGDSAGRVHGQARGRGCAVQAAQHAQPAPARLCEFCGGGSGLRPRRCCTPTRAATCSSASTSSRSCCTTRPCCA